MIAISNGKLKSTWAPKVTAAAVGAGLPTSSIPAFLEAMATGVGLTDVPGANGKVLVAAAKASEWAYARAYNLAWWSIVPFVVIALISVACLKGVAELMTERVEAPVEHVEQTHGKDLA